MSKISVRVTPVNSCDIAALEGWLTQMAAKGFSFTATAGPLTFFDQVEPKQLQIHLEPIQGAVEENPELNALYEAAGWAYLGQFRGSYFVYATDDLQTQAHTDQAALDYALKRFFKQRLIGGAGLLLFNILLLAFYWPGRSFFSGGFIYLLRDLRYFPLETIFRYNVIPFALSVVGLALADLSYLLGLGRLWQYRKTVRAGTAPKTGRRAVSGWLLAAGVFLLLPVMAQTAIYFSGLDYAPYPLEGSGFVTLAQVEGPDFQVTGDYRYNMDYISHGDTPLTPETWYHRQYGAFAHHDGGASLNEVPRLEIRIYRYLLPALAVQQADEWSRQRINGSGDYLDFGAVHGFDQALCAVRERWTAGNGREFKPGMILILRRGNTVLRAEYQGEKDLTDYLARFAEMFDRL